VVSAAGFDELAPSAQANMSATINSVATRNPQSAIRNLIGLVR